MRRVKHRPTPLAATSTDLGQPGRDRDFGYGLANFTAARRMPAKAR